MLRLTVSHPERPNSEMTFLGDSVTVGRSSENQLVLDDPAVSSRHGRFDRRGRQLVYTDLGSTNGTILHREGQALAITGRQVRGQLVQEQDRLKIGPFTILLESNDPLLGEGTDARVLEVQALIAASLDGGGHLGAIDPRQMERILAMIADGKATLGSSERLHESLRGHLFRLFPQITHLSLVLRDPVTGSLGVVFHESRRGDPAELRISHSIVRRVMREEVAVLLAKGQELQQAQSIVLGGIETAICAPLRNAEGTFGAIQLDVRGTRGNLSQADLALLVGVVDFVALLLDNARKHEADRSSILATLECLLREREPVHGADVSRARRVRALAVAVGRALRLAQEDLQVISAASCLLAWPRQKPPMLVYPDGFHAVPFVASCRDERLDGSGPHGLSGGQLTLPARILGLAATAVDRGSRDRTPSLLTELEAERDRAWDGACLDALAALLGTEGPATPPSADSTDEAA